ncbi:hypothetical protein [Streptomyces decoyicus]|uniref:hypothetical protein n=1 Tax=Streptomyces decoyicus TaxID=249567 RepID=UPI0004ABA1B3|nr:hypothetical protein [Streptomyces decoyicus]KOG39601.1 hypothetical protein ADK74_28280 [Streptomyces decoyicus]QZY14186.1 hypothetical protein K7C20_02180 [Streptomyces decoyicus]
MTDIHAVVARLRQLPDVSGGLVELEPGIDDARMDSWPVPVPEEIRVLFRSVGGIRITVCRSVVNGHTSAEHVDFTESFNNGEYLGHDVSWYLEHAGGPGSHWFVHLDHGDGHFYVDVDRETGAWGPVFQFWDATDTRRLALSLPMPSGWRSPTGGASRQGIRYRLRPSVRPTPGRPTTRCCERRRPDCRTTHSSRICGRSPELPRCCSTSR